MKVYCARVMSDGDVQTITALIERNPHMNRAALSRLLCELWQWRKPNGELKDMTCRVALLRMAADGLIVLPPSRMSSGRRRPSFAPTPATDPGAAIELPVHALAPLSLRLVAGTLQSRLWNEFVARYHYLGYTPMSGSQLRYNVFVGEQLVACLSFGASAWKLKDRERFIGWSEAQRSRNLHLVVNNARFLILPWVRSLGLASKILSKVARQLPKDWMARYGFAPVLLETFVEFERHKGTCYKAANWLLVGCTAGRGKKSTSNKPLIPIKDIWLYPLRRDWQGVLCCDGG
jgi:hypothetical protein